MGTYIDTDEVVEHLGNQVYYLLDVAVGATISANVALIRAIATADSVINDHLRVRYTLPLDTVGESLTAIAAAIVRFTLVQRRQDVINQEDRDVYNDAMRMLRDYRDGKNMLEFPPQSATVDRAVAEVVDTGSLNQSTQHLSGESWFESF